ncbi:unnamed protein product [Linum trigynum]|uniref:Uncharacterized protein n=1 Tax=Linum trigynum TaxID=586398 RepID=A0AAV2G506_9ROSI
MILKPGRFKFLAFTAEVLRLWFADLMGFFENLVGFLVTVVQTGEDGEMAMNRMHCLASMSASSSTSSDLGQTARCSRLRR